MPSYNLISATEEVEHFLQAQSTKQIWAELTVSISPTLSRLYLENEHTWEPKINLRSKKARELEALSLLSWYLPQEIRFLLQLELLHITEKQPYSLCRILLKSKAHAILHVQDILCRKGPRFLFGRFLEKKLYDSLPSLIRFKIKKASNVAIPEKRRIGVGYRDKGQLPNLAKGGALKDCFNKPLQLEIEERRKQEQDLLDLLEGFIT